MQHLGIHLIVNQLFYWDLNWMTVWATEALKNIVAVIGKKVLFPKRETSMKMLWKSDITCFQIVSQDWKQVE